MDKKSKTSNNVGMVTKRENEKEKEKENKTINMKKGSSKINISKKLKMKKPKEKGVIKISKERDKKLSKKRNRKLIKLAEKKKDKQQAELMRNERKRENVEQEEEKKKVEKKRSRKRKVEKEEEKNEGIEDNNKTGNEEHNCDKANVNTCMLVSDDVSSYDNFIGAPRSWECLDKDSGWYLIKTQNNFEFYFNILTNTKCWQCPEKLKESMNYRNKKNKYENGSENERRKENEEEEEKEKEKEKNKEERKEEKREKKKDEMEAKIEIYSEGSATEEDNENENENEQVLSVLMKFKDMLIEKNIKQTDRYEDVYPLIQYDIRYLSIPMPVRRQCFYLLLKKIHDAKANSKETEHRLPSEHSGNSKSIFSLIEDLKLLLQRTNLNSWPQCNEHDVHVALQNEKEYIGNDTRSWKKVRELLIKEYARKVMKKKEIIEEEANCFLNEPKFLLKPQGFVRCSNRNERGERFKMIYVDECVELFKKKAEEICSCTIEQNNKKKKKQKEGSDYVRSCKNTLKRIKDVDREREWKRAKLGIEQNPILQSTFLKENLLSQKEIIKTKKGEVGKNNREETEKNGKKGAESNMNEASDKNKKEDSGRNKKQLGGKEIDKSKEKLKQTEIEIRQEKNDEILQTATARKENGMEKNGMAKNGMEKNGTDKNGTDKNGMAKSGMAKYGMAKNGMEKNGTDKNGMEKNRMAKNGMEKNGMDKYGMEKNGTLSKETQKNGEGSKRTNPKKDNEIEKKKRKTIMKDKKTKINDTDEIKFEHYPNGKQSDQRLTHNEENKSLLQKNHLDKEEEEGNLSEKKGMELMMEVNDGTKMLFLLFANVERPVVNNVLLKSITYEEKEPFEKYFNIPDSIANTKIYKNLCLSDNEKLQVYKQFVISFTKTKINAFAEKIKALPIEYICEPLKKILKTVDESGKEFTFLSAKCIRNTYLKWKKNHVATLKLQFQQFLNDFDFSKYDFSSKKTPSLIIEHMSNEKCYQLLKCAASERDQMIKNKIKEFEKEEDNNTTDDHSEHTLEVFDDIQSQ